MTTAHLLLLLVFFLGGGGQLPNKSNSTIKLRTWPEEGFSGFSLVVIEELLLLTQLISKALMGKECKARAKGNQWLIRVGVF